MSQVSVITATILELLCGVFIINGLIGEERKIKVLEAGAFVITATLYITIVPAEWVNSSYVLTFLYVKLSYRVSWKDSLITGVLSLLLGGIAELICYFPFAFLLHERWTSCEAAFVSVILCYVLVKKFPVWHLREWCRRKEVWYIAVVLFSMVLMLAEIVSYRMTLELELGDYIYIISCVMLMWLMVLRLMKYRYEGRVRQKYFEAFCSVIDQIKGRQHKFQNQLDAVYSLHNLYGEYETLVEEQKKYLGKLVDYEMPTDVLILGNPILIAHVYEKLTEAQEAGLRIRMKLKASMEGCGGEDIHMVEILGTLFDNAIQDMVQTEQTEFLIFQVEEEDGIIIRVANPHREMKNQEIQRMFENGYSTKGEGRGTGLYHVKKLVQKYKIDLWVENRMMEGQNYICFSVVMGRSTPLA